MLKKAFYQELWIIAALLRLNFLPCPKIELIWRANFATHLAVFRHINRKSWNGVGFNPSPAEPGTAEPLQTV